MNVFKQFADTITEEVNEIEDNINDIFRQKPEEPTGIYGEESSDIDEELSNPRINSIFSELRTEFPSPTITPSPDSVLVIPGTNPGPTPTPTPSINIEGFEDVEKMTVSKKINNGLKEKFYDNFKF